MSCAARSIGSKLLIVLLATLSSAAGAAPTNDRVAPRIADRAVPKAYDIGGALALREDVAFTFLSVNGPVRIDVGRITNESTTTTSGSVRAALFLTESRTLAGGYYVVATIDLGALGPGQSFGTFADTVPFVAPPDGIYYAHIGAFEFEANLCNAPDGYCLDDYVSFTSRVQVSNGQIFDAGPPPPATTEAVEYYNTNFDHYFVTAFADEIALWTPADS